MMKQVKNLEGRMQAIEKQRDEIRNEIFKIESAGNFIEIMLPCFPQLSCIFQFIRFVKMTSVF